MGSPRSARAGDVPGRLERPRRRRAALERWLQLDPAGQAASPAPVGPFRKLLARSLLRSRRPAEARQVLADLLARGPDAEASWLLGRSYIQEKDWDRAAALLEPVLPFATSIRWRSNPPRTSARLDAPPAIPRSTGPRSPASTPRRSPAPGTSTSCSSPQTPCRTREITRSPMTSSGGTDRSRSRPAPAERSSAVIDYAFGSRDHFMTFVGRDDHGRSRMIRISHFQSPRGSGWDLATGLPPRPENPHEYLGTTMLEGDGVRRCLFCHTTNFRAVLDQAGPEAADLAIGCEKCHGPGGHHVAAAEAGFADPAIVNPGAAAGSRRQQDVRPVPRPPRHQRDLGAPDRPHLVPLPVAGPDLEPVLHGERWQPELRDLPRPARLRQDLHGPPGSEVPLLSRSPIPVREASAARPSRTNPCRRRHRRRKCERPARSIPPRGASSATCRAPGSSPPIPSRPIISFASAIRSLRRDESPFREQGFLGGRASRRAGLFGMGGPAGASPSPFRNRL